MTDRDQMGALDWMLCGAALFLGLVLGAGVTAVHMAIPPGYVCTARDVPTGVCQTWSRKP